MTIAIAWLRKLKGTSELVIASDSRLRSRGALDQAQKIFRLDRGDCCLAFCGDAQVAYPLFVQVATALNNFIKTRTRAEDITNVTANVGYILNNLIDSWDITSKEKAQELADTRILFSGWSHEHRKYHIGYFCYENRNNGKAGQFFFHRRRAKKPHPWRERSNSLTFIGDYEKNYMKELSDILKKRHPHTTNQIEKKKIDFDYEPIEALHSLIVKDRNTKAMPAIGGAVQMVKVYSYGSSLPFAIRTDPGSHFLLGRKLFEWEKTEYPILDLTGLCPQVYYPMSYIPNPEKIP
ncbi:hypothetical protein [Tistrella sp.]|uniref:hypothetical protein n=1 Tax=Tistrella sp. TaxID=2024861 RepID=UPI0025D0B6EE|nr:hypothetical protein [Tistrella sp.]|tara:strand:+ start:349 stop:1227 length:879 start_codon:yes stop_codon:yes gene_type:complete